MTYFLLGIPAAFCLAASLMPFIPIAHGIFRPTANCRNRDIPLNPDGSASTFEFIFSNLHWDVTGYNSDPALLYHTVHAVVA